VIVNVHASATVEEAECDFSKSIDSAHQTHLMQKLVESSKAKEAPQAATNEAANYEAPINEPEESKSEKQVSMKEEPPTSSTPMVDGV